MGRLALAALPWLLCASALAQQDLPAGESRVALVIGNAAYKESALRNPLNDARDMAGRLERLGFIVVKRENLRTKEIGATLREFRTRLSPGAVALFFYAGHGLQVKGVNYLPTVDAEIESEDDIPTQAVDLGKVLELMDEAKTRVNLIFLDACRNNPYARKFRSSAGGLAKVDAASGTLISFATRPGNVAADGDSRNGLYTQYLLKHMDTVGLPIEQMLKRVGAGVKLASGGRQEPWSEGLIEGDFFFRPKARVQTVAAVPPPSLKSAQWMTPTERQAEYDRRSTLGFRSHQIEGECQNGAVKYRGTWKPLEPGARSASYTGMSREVFEYRDGDFTSQGYSRVWLQHFTDCKGVERYQAVWLKPRAAARQP
jgi:hypothetical protein